MKLLVFWQVNLLVNQVLNLTMRTFHTGGIFTSEARQQIISPLNGIIRFYKILKTVILRTNRGEDVLVTKNSGSINFNPR